MSQEVGRTGGVPTSRPPDGRSSDDLQRGPRQESLAHGRSMSVRDCLRVTRATEEAALRAWASLHENSGEADATLGSLLLDCAQACRTTSDFMMRGSPLHGVTCKACEEVCEAVVEALAGKGGERWENLLGQVNACAASCREMARAMGIETTTTQRPIEEETETVGG